jgi:plasmid stability protein
MVIESQATVILAGYRASGPSAILFSFLIFNYPASIPNNLSLLHINLWMTSESHQKDFILSCYHYAIKGGIMAQIIVRNLDDDVVTRLKIRARDNDRSLEAEVRHILEQSAKVDMAQARQIALNIRERLKGRTFPDSAELIREDRER